MARLLIAGRPGILEVVFVAHMAASAGFAPGAVAESIQGFDSAEREFAAAVATKLGDRETRWRFQRRDGQIAHELVAVADELRHDYGAEAGIVIVVGSAMQTLHHVVGSVPVGLVRHAAYPVVVVP